MTILYSTTASVQSGKGDFRVPVWRLPVSCGDAGIVEERRWRSFATAACEATAPSADKWGKLVTRDSIRELLWERRNERGFRN